MAATGKSSRIAGVFLAASLLVPLITALLLSWHSLGVLDIWLHNEVGQGILSGEGFPRVNTYSFVEPEQPWINHEWLFQVLVAATGPKAGQPLDSAASTWNALRLVLSLLLAGVLILGDGTLGRLRGRTPWGGARPWLALPLLAGFLLLWPRLLLRPELVSYLLFVILVRMVDRPLSQWRRPPTVWAWIDPRLPFGAIFWLTVLWAQIHGFAALVPVVLILTGVTRTVAAAMARGRTEQPDTRSSWWLLAIPLSLLALCLTPNGLPGLVYPLRALGQFSGSAVDLRGSISELVPLLDTRDSLGWTLLAYKLSLVWGLLWVLATWGGTSLLRVVLWGLAAWAAFASQRSIGFYAVTFILLHTGTTSAPVLARLLDQLPHRLRSVPRQILAPNIPVALILALVAAVPWWLSITHDDFYLAEGVSRRFGAGVNPGRYPEQAAKLVATRPGLHLFTNVDAAAFMLNQGQCRLFIDGRTEAYSSGRWADYGVIKQADAQGLALLESYDPQGVFLSTSGGAFHPLARALLSSQRWDLVHLDATGILWRPGTGQGLALADESRQKQLADLGGQLPGPETHLGAVRAADLCLAQATVLNLGGAPELQEKALLRGLEFRSDHPALQHNMGNLLMARGNLETARDHFLRALEVNSRLSGSALNAGVCSMRLREPERAREFFRQATRIQPGSFEAWTNLGISMLAAGDQAEGRQALLRALEIQPGNQRVRSLLQ